MPIHAEACKKHLQMFHEGLSKEHGRDRVSWGYVADLAPRKALMMAFVEKEEFNEGYRNMTASLVEYPIIGTIKDGTPRLNVTDEKFRSFFSPEGRFFDGPVVQHVWAQRIEERKTGHNKVKKAAKKAARRAAAEEKETIVQDPVGPATSATDAGSYNPMAKTWKDKDLTTSDATVLNDDGSLGAAGSAVSKATGSDDVSSTSSSAQAPQDANKAKTAEKEAIDAQDHQEHGEKEDTSKMDISKTASSDANGSSAVGVPGAASAGTTSWASVAKSTAPSDAEYKKSPNSGHFEHIRASGSPSVLRITAAKRDQRTGGQVQTIRAAGDLGKKLVAQAHASGKQEGMVFGSINFMASDD